MECAWGWGYKGMQYPMLGLFLPSPTLFRIFLPLSVLDRLLVNKDCASGIVPNFVKCDQYTFFVLV